MDADGRLRVVAGALGLAAEEADPLASDSNDVWRIGELILRVCWRGDRARLTREALVLAHLPDQVPHAPLVDSGAVDDLTWMLTRRLPGTVAGDRADLRPLGTALAALHAWDPPPEVRAVLTPDPTEGAPSADGPVLSDAEAALLVGSRLNALPVDRALRLVAPATRLANLDPDLVVRLGAQLERLRPLDAVARPEEGVVVHGDAHLDNVLWDGDRLVALLDLEWARLGPPDLELQPLLLLAGPDAVRSVVDGYPAIAAHPDVVERLWLYDLAFTLRDLFVKAPLPATDDLPHWHPKRRLAEIVDSPAYIEAALGRP